MTDAEGPFVRQGRFSLLAGDALWVRMRPDCDSGAFIVKCTFLLVDPVAGELTANHTVAPRDSFHVIK